MGILKKSRLYFDVIRERDKVHYIVGEYSKITFTCSLKFLISDRSCCFGHCS